MVNKISMTNITIISWFTLTDLTSEGRSTWTDANSTNSFP